LPAPLRKLNIRRLHNQTAYLALLLVLVHPVLLVFDKDTKFRLADIVFPLHAPHQRFFVLLGTLAMFALIVVIITTQQICKKKNEFPALEEYSPGFLCHCHAFYCAWIQNGSGIKRPSKQTGWMAKNCMLGMLPYFTVCLLD
jgi:hypothetical protein